MSNVDIGFAVDCEAWQVESRLFPSKIGGKPAWLDLDDLPNVEDLTCDSCKLPMIFLCQIYAPYEENDENFHRTIFVFICRKDTCCVRNKSENIKVLRSSLPRFNKFYPSDPPCEEPDANFSLSKWVELCNLCGCKASKRCSQCKIAVYCCREHQVIDWKEMHKVNCGKDISSSNNSKSLFSEYEIIIEPEKTDVKQINETNALEEFNKLASAGKTGTLNEIPEDELEAHALSNEDKTFAHFRKHISTQPEQILRYERGGEPLWIANEPKSDLIPNCERCGSSRQFEFQIMPQMLSVLKENNIDWGIIGVYTCRNSCNIGKGYIKEFAFKQDI